MDIATLLIAHDQENNQHFWNCIQRSRGQIQHFTGLELAHAEHIRQLSNEFHHETTTQTRKAAILRAVTRTQRDIALIREMIDIEEDVIRMREENQRRRHEEIVNVVNVFLHPKDVQ